MGHVGDVYLQLEVAIRHAPHRHRIVEVACRLAIDGNDGQSAVILAVAQLARRNDRIEVLRLLQYLDGKVMRQVVLADDDLDVDAEIIFIAENLDHSAARILRRRRPLRDLDLDNHAFQVIPFLLGAPLSPAHDRIA